MAGEIDKSANERESWDSQDSGGNVEKSVSDPASTNATTNQTGDQIKDLLASTTVDNTNNDEPKMSKNQLKKIFELVILHIYIISCKT